MKLYEWKALLMTEHGVGLWTYVPAEDFQAAIENAQQLSGLEVVMVECLDEDKRIEDKRVAA